MGGAEEWRLPGSLALFLIRLDGLRNRSREVWLLSQVLRVILLGDFQGSVNIWIRIARKYRANVTQHPSAISKCINCIPDISCRTHLPQ